MLTKCLLFFHNSPVEATFAFLNHRHVSNIDSSSSLGEDTSSADAMMSAEAHDTDQTTNGSFEFAEILTTPTPSQPSETSNEAQNLAVAVTEKEQIQVATDNILSHDSFDSDAQIALALFAEEQAGNGAFFESWNPSGVVEGLESVTQDNSFADTDEPDEVADKHDSNKNEDDNTYDPPGYGSPVLRTFRFEVMDEPEPLLVEIILDEDAGTSNSAPYTFTG
jgi:hypothetical protein